MKRASIALLALAAALAVGRPAQAVILTDTLSQPAGELSVFNAWNQAATQFSWNVYLDGGNTYWTYWYQLVTPATQPGVQQGASGVSHLVMDVSETFTLADFVPNSFVNCSLSGTNPTNQTAGSGNPGIPATLWGVRLAPGSIVTTATTKTWTFQFSSYRNPTWGDLYVKGGGNPTDYLYNEGFLRPDPIASSNFGDNHIVVPDTTYVPPQGDPEPIPEPGTLALLGLGLGVVAKRRKRM